MQQCRPILAPQSYPCIPYECIYSTAGCRQNDLMCSLRSTKAARMHWMKTTNSTPVRFTSMTSLQTWEETTQHIKIEQRSCHSILDWCYISVWAWGSDTYDKHVPQSLWGPPGCIVYAVKLWTIHWKWTSVEEDLSSECAMFHEKHHWGPLRDRRDLRFQLGNGLEVFHQGNRALVLLEECLAVRVITAAAWIHVSVRPLGCEAELGTPGSLSGAPPLPPPPPPPLTHTTAGPHLS